MSDEFVELVFGPIVVQGGQFLLTWLTAYLPIDHKNKELELGDAPVR